MELKPEYSGYQNLEFMFETTFMLSICDHMMDESLVKVKYDLYKV